MRRAVSRAMPRRRAGLRRRLASFFGKAKRYSVNRLSADYLYLAVQRVEIPKLSDDGRAFETG